GGGLALYFFCWIGDIASQIEHNKVVPLAVARPVPVQHGELSDRVCLDAVQPHAQPGHAFDFDEFLVRNPVTGALQPPLAHESGPLIEIGPDVGQRDTFDDPVAPKWRSRYINIDRDIGTPIDFGVNPLLDQGRPASLDPPPPSPRQ